jgi:hypothetical protein
MIKEKNIIMKNNNNNYTLELKDKNYWCTKLLESNSKVL